MDAETEIIKGKLGEAETNLFFLLSNSGQIALPLHDQRVEHHLPLMIVVSANASDTASRATVFQFAGTALNPHNSNRTAPYFLMESISTLPGKMPVS